MLAPAEILFSLIPVLFVFLIYKRYISKELLFSFYLEFFLSGILLAALILIFSPWINNFLTLKNKYAVGFLNAALVEKSGAFLFIFVLLYKLKANKSILYSITSSMFFGLGFSFLENIFYSLEIANSSVVLVRTFSAVPIHVITCGVIGFFLGKAYFSYSKLNKFINISLGFFLPTLLHGIYDSCLLNGGKLTYFVGPELVFIIFFFEYLIAKALSTPPISDLTRKNILLEDWETIHRQAQYDRWILKSMGRRNEEYVPFFQLNIAISRWIGISLLLLLAITGFFFQAEITFYLKLTLRLEEKYTLFALFPLTMAFNLFLVGSINPLYFQNSIIRIPIISDVRIFSEVSNDQVTCMDISNINCFLKTLQPLENGTELKLTFRYSNTESPLVSGKVIWENHEDLLLPIGTILRFEQPFRKYRSFVIGYYWFRLIKGLLFNLKLPGFQKIREFFVKANTVMEDYNFFPSGAIIYKQGEPAKKFYLLQKGKLLEYKTTDNNEKIILRDILPGQIFGENSLVGNRKRNSTIICVEDSVLGIASADNLEALIESNSKISYKVIKSLVDRITTTEEEYENIIKDNIGSIERLEKRVETLQNGINYMLEGAVYVILNPNLEIEYYRKEIIHLLHLKEESLIGTKISSIISNYSKDTPGEYIIYNKKGNSPLYRVKYSSISENAIKKIIVFFVRQKVR